MNSLEIQPTEPHLPIPTPSAPGPRNGVLVAGSLASGVFLTSCLNEFFPVIFPASWQSHQGTVVTILQSVIVGLTYFASQLVRFARWKWDRSRTLKNCEGTMQALVAEKILTAEMVTDEEQCRRLTAAADRGIAKCQRIRLAAHMATYPYRPWDDPVLASQVPTAKLSAKPAEPGRDRLAIEE